MISVRPSSGWPGVWSSPFSRSRRSACHAQSRDRDPDLRPVRCLTAAARWSRSPPDRRTPNTSRRSCRRESARPGRESGRPDPTDGLLVPVVLVVDLALLVLALVLVVVAVIVLVRLSRCPAWRAGCPRRSTACRGTASRCRCRSPSCRGRQSNRRLRGCCCRCIARRTPCRRPVSRLKAMPGHIEEAVGARADDRIGGGFETIERRRRPSCDTSWRKPGSSELFHVAPPSNDLKIPIHASPVTSSPRPGMSTVR